MKNWLLCCILACFITPAMAGKYTEALIQCIEEKTTIKERLKIARYNVYTDAIENKELVKRLSVLPKEQVISALQEGEALFYESFNRCPVEFDLMKKHEKDGFGKLGRNAAFDDIIGIWSEVRKHKGYE